MLMIVVCFCVGIIFWQAADEALDHNLKGWWFLHMVISAACGAAILSEVTR